MISIIICSVNKALLHRITENIKDTIGVPFEMIAIDNSVNKDGICKVYNEGGKRAKFPVLCFVHEDVLFETLQWGERLIKHLSDNKVGLTGLAGGDARSVIPSSWSTPFQSVEVNIVQHHKKGKSISYPILKTAGGPGMLKPVTSLDGVMLCTKKEVFDQFKFDEDLLKGFHGYDMDYSLQVLSKYQVAVMFDILAHHYSEGILNREWMDSAILISRKWKQVLPVSVRSLTAKELTFFHWKSMQVFLQNLVELDYRYYQVVYYYLHYSFNRFFTLRNFLSMGKFILISMYYKSFVPGGTKHKGDQLDSLKYGS